MLNELLERLFPWTNRPSSRDAVKQRLKLVLAYDRASLNPGMLEAMRDDIVAVLSRYVELDAEQLQFTIENSDRATALIAHFPIRRVRAVSEETVVDRQEDTPVLELDTEAEPTLEELFVEDAPPETPLPVSPSEPKEEDSLPQTLPSSTSDAPKTDTPKRPSSPKIRKSLKSE